MTDPKQLPDPKTAEAPRQADAEDEAKRAILEEAEAAREEEDEGDDLGCRALERSGEIVEAILENDERSLEHAQFLATYSMAFDLHYVIGRFAEILEDIDEKIKSFSMASVMGAMMGGGMPAMDENAFPESPLREEGGASPSWLKDVLGDDPNGVPLGRKTVMVVVKPDDGGDLDAEHQAVCETMQARGWSIDKLNEELQKCQRPASATAQETMLR